MFRFGCDWEKAINMHNSKSSKLAKMILRLSREGDPLGIVQRATTGIGLHVNAHKTEYMCYNQTGDIYTLDGTSLKLVDNFTYLGSSVSSTEKDIDTRLTKHGQLSIGFRSYGNQTWLIKWNAVSSRQRSCLYCYVDELLGR